jgi:hypothetical protein
MATLIPHVILHVGGNKTGTTALQSAFSRNRQKLKERGVLYPDLKIIEEATRSHWPLAAAFMNNPHDYYLFKDRNFDEPSSRQLAQKVFARLEQQIVKAQYKTVILSSEALSMLAPVELVYLRDYFQARFEKISIIYIGREPVAGAVSFYQQALVGGGNVSFENLIESQNFKFGITAQKLHDVFQNDLILRIFKKENFINGDIITDFMVRYLGFEEGADQIDQSLDVNISLSAASAALLYYLNKTVRRREKGGRNPIFFYSRRFVKEYDRERLPPKLVIPDKRWNAYIRQQASEDWLSFLRCAKLDSEAKAFSKLVKQDEVEFGDIKPPTKHEIEIWMRKQNLSALDRSALPAQLRGPFSAGLARKA